MVHDNISAAMVRAINQIGQTMNIQTIAEFVESEAILRAVRDIGVDYAQGFYIAKPSPIEAGSFNEILAVDAPDADPAAVPVRVATAEG